MPFYITSEMEEGHSDVNPNISNYAGVGEFMKAALVTKPEGEGPPLHMHPNEEQWTFVVSGKMHYVLGEEEKIIEAGDIVHIPRFTNHRSRSIDGPASFFTVKSPAGDGTLTQDYNMVEGEASTVAEKKYEERAKSK
jgi:oxalate decarboxylase/phosphoglucose isomerase-like protein (cupin superfamily)